MARVMTVHPEYRPTRNLEEYTSFRSIGKFCFNLLNAKLYCGYTIHRYLMDYKICWKTFLRMKQVQAILHK